MKEREQKVWYKLNVRAKKHWWGYSHTDIFIEAKILGRCFHEIEHGDDYITYLIEIFKGKKVECFQNELFLERGEIEVC